MTGSVHVITSTYATSFSNVYIHQVPCVTLLLKGAIYPYKQDNFTLESLKDFVSDNLPHTVLEVG